MTELCAEVPVGQNYIGMKHCPRDGEPVPQTVIWEFRDVSAPPEQSLWGYTLGIFVLYI